MAMGGSRFSTILSRSRPGFLFHFYSKKII